MSKKRKSKQPGKLLTATATLLAEKEAGRIWVWFEEKNSDSCLLWTRDGVRLLERSKVEENVFEWFPEDYQPPTPDDVARLLRQRK